MYSTLGETGWGGGERLIHTMLFPNCFICFERKMHHFHFAARRVFGMVLFALCCCKQLGELSVPA